MAAWSLSKCLTHWHPIHVFVLFVFVFCISPSAYFCHIVKLLIKKETTRSFPTVFFLLSLPVSVGLITTNYNQQPLSSLLKSKCQKDRPCGFFWVINPTWSESGPARSGVKAPNLQHLHCCAEGREKPLFIQSVSGTLWQRSPPPFRPGAGQPQTLFQPMPFLPLQSHPWEGRSRWETKIEKLAGWIFILISSEQQRCVDSLADHYFCVAYTAKCQLWSSHPGVQLSFHPVTFWRQTSH